MFRENRQEVYLNTNMKSKKRECHMHYFNKARGLNTATFLHRTPTLEWWLVRRTSNRRYKKKHVFKIDWNTCSKLIYHSRLNNNIVGRTYVASLWFNVNEL